MSLFKSLIVVLVLACFSQNINSQNFSTNGNAIRHIANAKINGTNVLYIGELDGSLSLYDLKGNKFWRVETQSPSVLFEIESADINGDGNDELIAATANGNISCWNYKGEQLWNYSGDHKIRFSEVAVVKNNGETQIFAGGNDYTLYELDTKGQLVSKTKISGVVRKIEAGDFLETGKQSLFLMTYSHDKFRWEFMGILDANSKNVIKQVKYSNKNFKQLSRAMVTDINVADINTDGKDDIMLFSDSSFKPFFAALDGELNVIAQYVGNNKQAQRYAHSQGTFIPSKSEIIFQHGGLMLILDNQGKLKETGGSRYGKMVFSDFTLEPNSNQLIAAGEVDGGNAIYFYDLSKKNWWKTVHKKVGRMLEVENNLSTLYKQTLKFNLPDYQKKSESEWVMITPEDIDPRLDNLGGGKIKFVIQKSPKESTDRSHLVKIMGDVALKKDRRGKYQDSREAIVQMARDYEASGQPFTFWAGHGNDPFYIQIETLEKILEVAPNTCYGFVYAEMHNPKDPRVVHFINDYLPRLAKAIRKNNKAKLYFRYKNMFWAATSHLPLWKDMFFSGEYSDFLVPASEDTSNRIQDLNLAGRVGMFSGGYVNDFAMRLIDDNPTSWRPLSPGGQNSVSPYLRQGVIMAAYGAKYGVVSTSGFVEEPGLNTMFALMKSGVLPIVEKQNILSIGSWHLIKDVDEHLIHSVDNHHNLKLYESDDENAVFSVAQMHWAGTNIPEYDYSKIALGVNYRWTNYMPEMPNGMVPIAPIESAKDLKQTGVGFSISDGKHGFINNEKVDAKTFGPELKKVAKEGAENLPVLIEGASWSAIKLDENHIRVIMVDPGYLDPQERHVVVKFQNRKPKQAIDILSNETLKISDNQLKLKVPAGSMRFIDVSY
ncbi:WD40 repeat domain-containing protein [Seonamhaeicola maritimus]|uniref:WD40 repeat domain-containing protein n=1 Tax=Seonamhaeicola maritimus TaxID=2591822 RepID=A0A5C7GKT4_9FLAO|nr:WD40 repeat domain-containing protein [Seonamhaeicola maritimus]TXG39089.1 WD40 repeat domain-containing protein [Seonamhaeicola maritimus]